MHIAIHYNCWFDNRTLLYIHTINYNYNGKYRSVIIKEDNNCEYSDEHIRDIVFNDMRKYIKIYRK